MRPMSRKTRIGCPLPQFVEWALVGSRSLLLDPLRSSLRAGAIRRECKSLAHSSGPPQPADLTTPARTNRQMTNDDIAFLRQLADWHDRQARYLLLTMPADQQIGRASCRERV